jgi:hypothetical protein
MITSARIAALNQREDGTARPDPYGWITALRAPAIRKLMADDGSRQLSLFDQQDLAEITSPDFPGERLIACRNRCWPPTGPASARTCWPPPRSCSPPSSPAWPPGDSAPPSPARGSFPLPSAFPNWQRSCSLIPPSPMSLTTLSRQPIREDQSLVRRFHPSDRRPDKAAFRSAEVASATGQSWLGRPGR